MARANYIELVGELFSLLGRYESNEIASAREYLDRSMRGRESEFVARILSEMYSYSRYTTRGELSPEERAPEPTGKFPERQVKKAGDSVVRELTAMLSDEQFLPTKKDLLQLVQEVMRQTAPESLAKKAGRSSIVGWAISRFREKSETAQGQVFSAIRQYYLKQRSSSLAGWTDIFSRGK